MRGVDLAHLSAAQFAAIQGAWYRHELLVFRGQKLSDDDLLAFSRRFGALGDGEALWHTDRSYAAMPPDASMLYSLEIPAARGRAGLTSAGFRAPWEVSRVCRPRPWRPARA